MRTNDEAGSTEVRGGGASSAHVRSDSPRSEPPRSEPLCSEPQSGEVVRSDSGEARALVVDDDSLALESVARTLRSMTRGDHFTVDTSTSGAKAIEMARAVAEREERYAVAFVDMSMPNMDGLGMARELWALDPELPVVVFTGQQHVPLDDLGEQANHVLVLKKPGTAIEIQQAALAMAASRALKDEEKRYEAVLRVRVFEETQHLERAREVLEHEAAERARTERQLAETERLRFVGQLASSLGIEINSPLQYVRDAVVLLAEAYTDLRPCIDGLRAASKTCADAAWVQASEERLEELGGDAVFEELEESLEHCRGGLDRVDEIIGALKRLTTTELDEKEPASLSQVVLTALTLTKNQYKYCAKLDYAAPDVPLASINASAIQQVVINLIVNASHAIEDRLKGTGKMGFIRIRVFEEGDSVAVSIEDSGGGIPDSVRERMYDPFFTTKEVGRGTGQGLSIARSIVVDGHGGELRCETEAGVGTTFTIVLPKEASALGEVA